jgi:hypothetical protein
LQTGATAIAPLVLPFDCGPCSECGWGILRKQPIPAAGRLFEGWRGNLSAQPIPKVFNACMRRSTAEHLIPDKTNSRAF